MIQSGHWCEAEELTPDRLKELFYGRIETLDTKQAQSEVEPFLKNPQEVEIWSPEFFRSIFDRIVLR